MVSDQVEHCEHVVADRRCYAPQRGGIEAATGAGVPPGQQEVGNRAGLTRVGGSDLEQALQRTQAGLGVRTGGVVERV